MKNQPSMKDNKETTPQLDKITLKFLACFMISLMLTMPVYISSVYAPDDEEIIEDEVTAQITNIIATGKDDVGGYTSTQEDDFIKLIVSLVYTKEAFDKSQLWIYFNDLGKYTPEECTSSEASTYECVFQTSIFNTNAGIVNYEINLVDISSLILDTETGSIIVDGLSPTLSLSPTKKAAEQKVTFKLDAEDKACTATTCTNKCSGLADVQLYIKEGEEGEEGTAKEPFHEITTFEKCKYSEIISKTYTELGITGGEIEFCAKALDKVGLEKETCVKENLDVTAPEIIDTSFTIKKGGMPLNYIKKDEIPKVDIYINVTDDNPLATTNIIGDFSGLNPKKSAYKTKKADSVTTYTEGTGEDVITTYEASWKSIELNNPEGLTAAVKVADADGNSAESSFTITLNIDEVAPALIAIYTDLGTLYLNNTAKNTIYADISESESGLSKDTVWLDLTSITGEPKKAPTECIALEGGYTCKWTNINPSKMKSASPMLDPLTNLIYVKKLAKLHPETHDLAGNTLSADDINAISQELIYDGTAPEIYNIDVSSASAGGSALGEQGTIQASLESASSASPSSSTPSPSQEQPPTGQAIATQAITEQAGAITGQPIGVLITNAEDEVIIITAQIFEQGSVVDPSKILAQLTTKELWPIPTPATSCEPSEEDYVYDCVWELPTVSVAGNYQFEISVTDMAGNTITSLSQKFKVYQVVEKEVDFFNDEFKVDVTAQYGSDYALNKNFLFMSTQTLFNLHLDITNQRKAGALGSFVHELSITECTASLGEVFAEGDLKPVAIVTQTYPPLLLPTQTKEIKELMLALPQFEQEKLKDKETLVVACKGELVQSSKTGKKAFTPNEIIVFSAEIPMGKDLFSNPGDSTLDAVLKYEDAIDMLDTMIDILDFLTKLAPFCRVINLVMQIWNNLCNIYYGLGAAFAPASVAAHSCALGSDLLNKIWYGRGGTPTDVGTVEKIKNQWNDKEELSLGFICDLTLCSSCSQAWNNKITGGALNIDEWTPDAFWSEVGYGPKLTKEDLDNMNRMGKQPIDPEEFLAGSSQIRFPFDPQKNFWVALICWPPCLPTIQRTLEMVKRILVAQNTCYNKAYLLGENIEDCPDLAWRLFCVLTFGQFMHVLPDILRQYTTKLVSSFLSRTFEVLCDTPVSNPTARMQCGWIRAKHAIVGFISFMDLMTNLKQLNDELDDMFDWGDSSSDDDKPEDEFSAQKKEFGELPGY